MEKKNVIPAVIGISTFILGFGVGYAICRHQFRKSRVVETIVKAEKPEVDQPELPFGAGYDEPIRAYRDPDQEDPVAIWEIERETPVPTENDDPGDYLVNPFRGVEDDYWNYEDEEAKRASAPERPYVIHYEEYRANEKDYPQSSIMYYEGDDVLCDELDVPIYTKDKLMGPLLFGHGSMDPNIVYIRNDKIECEWEILRNPGHFGMEVLGLDEEPIQHSTGKKKKKEPLPKFRMD